jgi:hypothetical protein
LRLHYEPGLNVPFRFGGGIAVAVLVFVVLPGCERTSEDVRLADEPEAATLRVCDIVPAVAVAEAVAADPAEMRVEEASGACHYAWPDGAAQIGPLAVAPSVEEAEALFESMFGWRLTSDSVAVSPSGEPGAPLEPVEGVGDRAAYDGRVGYSEDRIFGTIAAPFSNLFVRYRNVVIEVTVSTWQPRSADATRTGPDADELAFIRETTVVLGRRVVTYLARQTS